MLKRKMLQKQKLLLSFLFLLSFSHCMKAYLQTVGGEASQTFERIYLTDPDTAWGAILEALKNTTLETSNKEGGILQTQWTDNTAEKNFSQLIGPETYLKAQFRFTVRTSSGFYNGQATVKVSIQKEQWVQKDVLEGWRPLPTDTISENTLLYRIGRVIFMKLKIREAQEKKTQEALKLPL